MDAKYIDSPIFPGNPFIEALPPMLSELEFVEKTSYSPVYHPDFRRASPMLRREMLTQIKSVFQPIPFTVDLYVQFYCAMISAYSTRGMGTCESAALGQGGMSFSVVGISGVGKSANISKALSVFPQIIKRTLLSAAHYPSPTTPCSKAYDFAPCVVLKIKKNFGNRTGTESISCQRLIIARFTAASSSRTSGTVAPTNCVLLQQIFPKRSIDLKRTMSSLFPQKKNCWTFFRTKTQHCLPGMNTCMRCTKEDISLAGTRLSI